MFTVSKNSNNNEYNLSMFPYSIPFKYKNDLVDFMDELHFNPIYLTREYFLNGFVKDSPDIPNEEIKRKFNFQDDGYVETYFIPRMRINKDLFFKLLYYKTPVFIDLIKVAYNDHPINNLFDTTHKQINITLYL
jgi:hypothetical protein